MTSIADLKVELDTDALGRGYAGMTDQQAADDLNTEYRPLNRTVMTSSEVFQSIDATELTALTDGDRALVMDILKFGELDPFGNEATVFTQIFGGGSTTITALQAARVTTQSRAAELGFGTVARGEVQAARSI